MKKAFFAKASLLALVAVIGTVSLTACGSTPISDKPSSDNLHQQESAPAEAAEDNDRRSGASKLVLYASTPEEFLKTVIGEFENKTGVTVELVAAGTGELYKRIEAEGSNPLGDVMLGGMVSSGYMPNEKLWEEYVSPEDSNLPSNFQNKNGKVTSFRLVPSVIMVNNENLKQAGITVAGFDDLLNPSLKGRVVMPDPSQTSSGWEALVNALYAKGNGDTAEGWDYVEKLLANMEGKLLQGSSAVHKGIADGEYSAGIVAEGMVDTYLEKGVDVSKVFMKEGVVVNVDGVAIIKGAKNLENAKKFVDFLISKEFQELMPKLSPPRRPVRDDVDMGSKLPSVNNFKLIDIDSKYIAENKNQMLDHFKDLATNFE